MTLSELTAVSPIDGRYRGKTDCLAPYFSEYALIKYRVRVEIEYFIALTSFLKIFDVQKVATNLRAIYENFSEADAQRVKDIEKVTNHDVKAVEYCIKEKIDEMTNNSSEANLYNLADYKEFIHFGLTSQDINNTSVPLSIKEALVEVYYPMMEELIVQLQEYAEAWKDIPMLAKTHGQPASPTRLGKEVMVYVYRLTEQLDALKACKLTAKFGGATGWSVNNGQRKSQTTIIWVLCSTLWHVSIQSLLIWIVTSGCTSQWSISNKKSRPERLVRAQCLTK